MTTREELRHILQLRQDLRRDLDQLRATWVAIQKLARTASEVQQQVQAARLGFLHPGYTATRGLAPGLFLHDQLLHRSQRSRHSHRGLAPRPPPRWGLRGCLTQEPARGVAPGL